MQLKRIFEKPVDRTIEGVIKADDDASLRLEIEEYVLTKEVEARLESFLDAYNNFEGANGVWVSGFFGSGKSHLLKMLALLLENRLIDGAATLDLFLPKCNDNEILRGDLKRSAAIPSRSILFNIDQKADVISKTQIDALLAVFVKVFDEMCGYYGKHGHIAQFERDLDSRNLYQQFQDTYESIAGRSWQKGREQALLEGANIARAYAQVTGTDEENTKGILDKYRAQYRVSIEDFADQVKAYIDQQESGFRLNFFIDEVGQYVADNVKLMTNLQTIAESLATKCRGQAWIIVTAQEDMSNVVGEMNRQQSNDFTKIQARFANRMKLTSTNVAEVIQKRLLLKNEEGVAVLSDIYHREMNNFKTLFDFADGSVTFKNYRDREHFIHSYPFIPYQFDLFQSAIQNLSQHNAFEGQHSSVGERSMLGVFQQVAVHIGGHSIGQLATFDLMFEGIRTALKSHIQSAIQQAERNLEDPLALRLLKALFLVKYIREFKASHHNLSILVMNCFQCDLPKLRKEVEQALSLLEQQTYIQRNGGLYEYLTDQEKDVEQEIKNTSVENSDVTAELEKIVFDQIIRTRKIRYEDNGQDYIFTRKLDDKHLGREYELAINVITPFHEHADNDDMLRTRSTYERNELMVVMPSDDRIMRDLLMYKRTEKYVAQNTSMNQQESMQRILSDKSAQNRQRYAELQQRLQVLLGKARLLVGGTELDTGREDAQNRITKGFYELIALAYPNLRMLRNVVYIEADVVKCLKESAKGLIGADTTTLSEAEQEMLAFIQSNQRGGVRTTIKSLLEKFERGPYGWYYAAILYTLASLCARGKLEARADGNLLEEDTLERALLNTHGQGNVVLEPQVEFSASQIRALKEFYEDFFASPVKANEAKALGREVSEAFKALISDQLTPLQAQVDQYPLLQALQPVVERLRELASKPYTWYLTELVRQEGELLDLKESVLDPIQKFMSGPQKQIYENTQRLLQEHESNLMYLGGDTGATLRAALADPECFKGNRMQQVKADLDSLQVELDRTIDAELIQAKDAFASLRGRLSGMSEFSALSPDQQSLLTRTFDEAEQRIASRRLIAEIRDGLRNFEDNDYPRLLSQLANWGQPPMSDQSEPPFDEPRQQNIGEPTATPPIPTKAPQTVEYVNRKRIDVPFDKAWLADEGDVERYLEAVREALLTEIRLGKRIQI
ncbi:BREX system P-loop protein BrxC [Porticoccus hydrocarbonoclasticus]|uniref:BREX system P-loop protein BrxC n=1 Tax=Porticoccus hydrocarbonoclasticus TaxID=1073414 RepID=UPI00056050A9|nr:BREX system P-loop protein BrxC [Porticoccus hydrocarbonoclasticus]